MELQTSFRRPHIALQARPPTRYGRGAHGSASGPSDRNFIALASLKDQHKAEIKPRLDVAHPARWHAQFLLSSRAVFISFASFPCCKVVCTTEASAETVIVVRSKGQHERGAAELPCRARKIIWARCLPSCCWDWRSGRQWQRQTGEFAMRCGRPPSRRRHTGCCTPPCCRLIGSSCVFLKQPEAAQSSQPMCQPQ